MKPDKLAELVRVLSLVQARAEIYFPALDFRKKKTLEKSSDCSLVHIANNCLKNRRGSLF